MLKINIIIIQCNTVQSTILHDWQTACCILAWIVHWESRRREIVEIVPGRQITVGRLRGWPRLFAFFHDNDLIFQKCLAHICNFAREIISNHQNWHKTMPYCTFVTYSDLVGALLYRKFLNYTVFPSFYRFFDVLNRFYMKKYLYTNAFRVFQR